jgi:hypothetical protein
VTERTEKGKAKRVGPHIGTAEGQASDTTHIRLRRGDGDQAARVRSALGVGQVSTARDPLRQVDVTVILGSDFQPDEDGRP